MHDNLSPAELAEQAILRGEGRLAANGAFVAETGKYTGRSPKDKFVVRDAWAEANVAFGSVNQPMDEPVFDALLERVIDYLKGKEVFLFDGAVGKSPAHRLRVRVITELAWHNAFARNMLVRDGAGEAFAEWSLIYAPGFEAVPERDGTRSEAFVIIHFGKRIILIGGTHYAGEIKKSVFTVLNYLLPQRGVFPMHCSANVGEDGDVALFFGLSGTGKTTLSADPNRRAHRRRRARLVRRGRLQLRGRLLRQDASACPREKEPQIWDAIRFGACWKTWCWTRRRGSPTTTTAR